MCIWICNNKKVKITLNLNDLNKSHASCGPLYRSVLRVASSFCHNPFILFLLHLVNLGIFSTCSQKFFHILLYQYIYFNLRSCPGQKVHQNINVWISRILLFFLLSGRKEFTYIGWGKAPAWRQCPSPRSWCGSAAPASPAGRQGRCTPHLYRKESR